MAVWISSPTLAGSSGLADGSASMRSRGPLAAGKPIIRIRRPAELRSRAQRLGDGVAELAMLQAQFAAAPVNFGRRLTGRRA